MKYGYRVEIVWTLGSESRLRTERFDSAGTTGGNATNAIMFIDHFSLKMWEAYGSGARIDSVHITADTLHQS